MRRADLQPAGMRRLVESAGHLELPILITAEPTRQPGRPAEMAAIQVNGPRSAGATVQVLVSTEEGEIDVQL